MVLHADENVDNELIWDVVESLVKVADTSLGMLLKDLEFGILLVQLMSDGPANDVGKHGFKGLLVAVVVLDGHKARVVLHLLVSLAVGLLAHDSDRLVGSLNLNWNDIADRDTINHCSLLGLFLLSFHSGLMHLDLFGGKVAGAARIVEAFFDALSLAHCLVVAHNRLSCELLGYLIGDTLKFFVLHLSSNGLSSVIRYRIVLILKQLLLNGLN